MQKYLLLLYLTLATGISFAQETEPPADTLQIKSGSVGGSVTGSGGEGIAPR